MRYRRFRTADGALLDALLTVDADEFSTPAESHRADHERGYGVTVTVVEDDRDPWDGVSALVKAPPRPVTPPPPPTLAAVIAAEMPKVRADPALNAASKAALDKIIAAAGR